MTAKKVLIITGDAVEALEVYYPYFRCLEEGFDVDIAAPHQKKLNTVIHDFEDWETYTEKPGYLIEAGTTFAEVAPENYDALIIPGGRAPEHIRMNEEVPGMVRHFFENDKPVAVMCHGSLVLTTVPDVARGRKMTAYSACQPEVESIGAEYMNEMDYVDGNLVSGHAWPDLPNIMKEFVKQVKETTVHT
ncbi:DJ-1/PfpI/YhbO family deglycase/protease [Halobacillus litoralis]|uniref:DJ-1/PfpI/YhbO family deglycase/protease n=1 Tax=Halobacillus litoralis TaxID=45668 RepID=A0A845E026_9BACI|nr:DJ-1/PfpI family protein [Halobacillus litoralis]MYL19637.1 DJ-1/PfpI/YhbO family deglycase/protease [Halobacillus litoralis]MYL37033.1 DJ-1/PfpI/YhbO family deglycase/protease [Halobacillus litoralis]